MSVSSAARVNNVNVSAAYYVNSTRNKIKTKKTGEAGYDTMKTNEITDIKGYYMMELMRTESVRDAWKSLDIPKCFEEVSKKYTELLAGINEKYGGNEEKRLNHTAELDVVFEGLLKSVAYAPIFSVEQESIRVGQHPHFHKLRLLNETENDALNEQYKSNHALLHRLDNNMRKHASSFYEDFMSLVNKVGYKQAFADSMSNLEREETYSFDDISYKDMLAVLSKIKSNGNELKNTFLTIANDENINETIRKEIANIYDYQVDFTK